MMNVKSCSGLLAKVAAAASLASTLVSFGAFAAPLNLSNGDQVRLEWGAGTYGHADGGGEFKLSGVSVLNGLGDSFLTFCLEYPEHISLGTPYYVRINTGATMGGAGVGATYGSDVSGTSGFDPLSTATAWLYTQYRNQTLQNFVGAYSYTSDADANALQSAIWYLENERPSSSLDSRALELVSAATSANWTDIGDVRVLNFFTSYDSATGVFSGNRQDQLYLAPAVPEPETYTMLLAGIGLLAWTVRRKKRGLSTT